jgi:hypothetical protein
MASIKQVQWVDEVLGTMLLKDKGPTQQENISSIFLFTRFYDKFFEFYDKVYQIECFWMVDMSSVV